MNLKNPILKVSVSGVLAALSLVAIIFIRIPIFPAAPFLVYDMADIPILLGTLLLGPLAGEAILLIVCLIQAFFLGGDGIIGFCMHFIASSAMVLVMGLINKYKQSFLSLCVSAAAAILAMTVVMIPVSYIFYPLYNIPVQAVSDMLWPIIIPFNLIKSGANSILSVIIYLAVKPVANRILTN